MQLEYLARKGLSIDVNSVPFRPERAGFGKIWNGMGTLKIPDTIPGHSPESGNSHQNQVVPAGMDEIVQFRLERLGFYFLKFFP